MRTLAEHFDSMNRWAPVVLVVALWMLVLPARLAVLLLLPIDAIYPRHPLYDVREFFAFKN